MCDDEHRHRGLSSEVPHDDQHLAHELGVERRRHLVEQHHVRVHHQRPRDRDALLLTAGELVRVLPGLLLEADAREQLVCPRLGLLPRNVLHATRGERHVVDRPEVWEEIELLEDDADALAHRRHVRTLRRDLFALEEDPARVDRFEQVYASQQRALAAATAADDDEHLAGVDPQVDAVEDDELAEALLHVLQTNHRAVGGRRRRLVDPRL